MPDHRDRKNVSHKSPIATCDNNFPSKRPSRTEAETLALEWIHHSNLISGFGHFPESVIAREPREKFPQLIFHFVWGKTNENIFQMTSRRVQYSVETAEK